MEKATKSMYLNLDKEAHAALMELTAASGIPASHIVAHLVQSNVAHFERLTKAHKAAVRAASRSLPELMAA